MHAGRVTSACSISAGRNSPGPGRPAGGAARAGTADPDGRDRRSGRRLSLRLCAADDETRLLIEDTYYSDDTAWTPT